MKNEKEGEKRENPFKEGTKEANTMIEVVEKEGLNKTQDVSDPPPS